MAENNAGPAPANSTDQTQKSGEVVQSIETDQKANEGPTSQVTDDQWKAMWDIVMAIYDYREAEYVIFFLSRKVLEIFLLINRVHKSVAMTLQSFSIAASINATCQTTMMLSKNRWH